MPARASEIQRRWRSARKAAPAANRKSSTSFHPAAAAAAYKNCCRLKCRNASSTTWRRSGLRARHCCASWRACGLTLRRAGATPAADRLRSSRQPIVAPRLNWTPFQLGLCLFCCLRLVSLVQAGIGLAAVPTLRMQNPALVVRLLGNAGSPRSGRCRLPLRCVCRCPARGIGATIKPGHPEPRQLQR